MAGATAERAAPDASAAPEACGPLSAQTGRHASPAGWAGRIRQQ